MRRLVIAAARRAGRVVSVRAQAEDGFTMIEVLTAVVVLAIGLGAVMQMLVVATHATATNRIRQAETSLARELTEDARSLAYTQLNSSGLAAALQPTVPNSQISGSSLVVTRTLGAGNTQGYSFNASFTACSLDDPADGYGNHSSPPASGGSWCPDVAASGTQDSTPDDYKRVSVTVSPASGRTTPTVQQTILVYAKATHGPAVSCLSVNTTCPGANVLITTGSSQAFNVTTTVPAASVEWLVNGVLPTSAQLGSGLDPYTPSGSTSQFTWYFPTTIWNGATYTIDGTYTISALGFDVNGNQGTRSSLQVTLNEHVALPPSTVSAGWNQQIHGVDLQWVPSVDQDIRYYAVYHQIGSTISQVTGCTQVTGLTCTDLSAPSPGTEPSTCTGSPGNYQSFTTPNLYWVIGVDTDPTTGAARPSSFQSTHIDANLCDHPPSAPTSPSASGGGGTVSLSWSLPASPADPDPGDGIKQWRIYRWPVGQNPSFPGSRLDLIGEKNASGNDVTSYTDRSADPGGVQQDYCVTAVDAELNESTCSTPIVSG